MASHIVGKFLTVNTFRTFFLECSDYPGKTLPSSCPKGKDLAASTVVATWGGRPGGPHSQETLSRELLHFQLCTLVPALCPHPTLCPETHCFSSPENKPVGTEKGLCRVKKRIWVYNCFSSNHFSLSPPLSPEITVTANVCSLVGTEVGRFCSINVTVLDFPHWGSLIQCFLKSYFFFFF